MDLSDILNSAADQDRGSELELLNPATGEATGIKLRIAGPDSETQRRARLYMQDELIDAGSSIDAAVREKIALRMLAACILGWEIKQDGKDLPLTTRAAMQLLGVSWVREQVDSFAASRDQYLREVT